MIAIAMPMPADLPHEPTEIAVKLAAAQAAQATASAAQQVADECQKTANQAIAADPLADTQGVPSIREVCHEAMDSAIVLLRKINTPKE